jgi:hypothetical protein
VVSREQVEPGVSDRRAAAARMTSDTPGYELRTVPGGTEAVASRVASLPDLGSSGRSGPGDHAAGGGEAATRQDPDQHVPGAFPPGPEGEDDLAELIKQLVMVKPADYVLKLADKQDWKPVTDRLVNLGTQMGNELLNKVSKQVGGDFAKAVEVGTVVMSSAQNLNNLAQMRHNFDAKRTQDWANLAINVGLLTKDIVNAVSVFKELSPQAQLGTSIATYTLDTLGTWVNEVSAGIEERRQNQAGVDSPNALERQGTELSLASDRIKTLSRHHTYAGTTAGSRHRGEYSTAARIVVASSDPSRTPTMRDGDSQRGTVASSSAAATAAPATATTPKPPSSRRA